MRTPPPKSSGALNEAIEVMNVRSAAAINDGVSCGKTIRVSTRARPAPKLRPASASAASILLKPAPVRT